MASNSQPGPSNAEDKKSDTFSSIGTESETFAGIQSMVRHISLNEPEIASLNIYELTRMCKEEPWCMKLFARTPLQKKLEYIIEHNDTSVLTWALLLMSLLYKDEDLAIILAGRSSLSFVTRVMKLYNHFSVARFQSYCLSVLTGLTKNCNLRNYMYGYGVGGRIFKVLDTSVDRHVQKESLEFFMYLMSLPDIDKVLSQPKQVSLRCLISYLDDMSCNIQELAMKALVQLSGFQNDYLRKVIINEGLVLTMFTIVMTTSKSSMHQCAMAIISNTMRSAVICKHVAESKEFVKFLEFMDTCSDEFAIFSAKVVTRISEEDELLQVLHDLGAEDGLVSLLRFSDALINYELCCCANNTTKHRQLCDKILNEDVLESLIDLAIVPLYPNYFRTKALETIYHFMVRNSRMLNMLYKVDKDSNLKKVFVEDAEILKDECVEYLLRIFQLCCISLTFRKRMEDEYFCRRLLQYFVDANVTIAVAAMDVMKHFVQDEKFLQHFVCWNGPRLFVQKIRCTIDEDFLKTILSFILDAACVESVCYDFINERLHICLENLNPNIRKMRIVAKVLDKICTMFLPMKFHRKRRIEVEEVLGSGFYAISGVWQGDFPLLDEIIKNPVTQQYTVYLVDYTANPEFGDNEIPAALRRPRKYKRLFKRTGKRDVSVRPNLPTIPESTEISVVTYRSVKMMNPVYYKSISQDPFLPQLVEAAGRRIHRMRNVFAVSEQVKDLARFVELSTAGPDNPEDIQLYLSHIQELKKEQESNIIPIGCVKRARGIERAILFKALADKVGLLASLVRGANGYMWNETPMNLTPKEYVLYDKASVTFGVVDLMNDIGRLMVLGSKEADTYCGVKTYVKFVTKRVPFLRSK